MSEKRVRVLSDGEKIVVTGGGDTSSSGVCGAGDDLMQSRGRVSGFSACPCPVCVPRPVDLAAALRPSGSFWCVWGGGGKEGDFHSRIEVSLAKLW